MATNSGGPTGNPPGGGPNDSQIRNAATSAQAEGGKVEMKKMRSFQQIMAEEKERRNILEIKVRGMKVTLEDGTEGRAKALTTEDISVLIFEVLKFNPEDCATIALVTNRYDTKEIKLKPEVDPSIYLTSLPVQFKDHEIMVSKQTTNITKVTFKNVPLNIPDEEIVNLCQSYGKPINNLVKYDKPSSWVH